MQAFKAKYGQDRVIGDPMQVAYNSVHLWKLAVEKAKSFDPDAVIAASAGLTLEAPEGTVRVHERTITCGRRCGWGAPGPTDSSTWCGNRPS